MCAFKGWNDAGESATSALAFVAGSLGAESFASIDPEEFVDFQTTRPTVRLEVGITRTIDWPEFEVHDPEYLALLERLLADEALRADWRRAPCTRGGHHAYLGGLLEHTVAVGTLALEACQLHPRLNSDLLICAALVHDLGKTREFTYGAAIELSEEGRMLGHIPLGQQLLDARSGGMSSEKRLALAHCVLTHHGADPAPGRRFGSPEALALYRLNALDASVKGALEHGLPN